jgi:hypothetical protein
MTTGHERRHNVATGGVALGMDRLPGARDKEESAPRRMGVAESEDAE